MYYAIKELRRKKAVNDVMTVVFGVCAFALVCLAIGLAESENYLGTYGVMALAIVCGILSCNADVNSTYYATKEREITEKIGR